MFNNSLAMGFDVNLGPNRSHSIGVGEDEVPLLTVCESVGQGGPYWLCGSIFDIEMSKQDGLEVVAC